jgi:hypothetical protein
MAGMNKSLEEYEKNNGWSSSLFSANAISLMGDLVREGVDVSVGRTVIHLKKNNTTLKAYVHYKGRSEEYATITDYKGNELLTVHYAEFEKLSKFIKGTLCP